MGYSDENTYEKILARVLSNDGLANVDKRVGSIIYDAVAPLCLELANAYVMMDMMETQMYLQSCTGSSLDKRSGDYGISRRQATNAERIAEFMKYKKDDEGKYVVEDGERVLVPASVPFGMRFSVPNDASTVFRYVGTKGGYEILECESAGSAGNVHVGSVLPINPIEGLAVAKIVGTYVPAEDTETDDALRDRIVEYLNEKPYGGNIADYREKVNSISGVRQTKVFPAWKGNGSVLISIVDTNFSPVSQEFIRQVKEYLDPEEYTGQGVGIAPIGHYVTVTTPSRREVGIKLSLELPGTESANTVIEAVTSKIEEYFDSVRREFNQDVNLTIYRSYIIGKVLELNPRVLNVKDVLIDGIDDDLRLVDEGLVGYQYLPYVGEVTIEQ